VKKCRQISHVGHVNIWGVGQGTLLSKILPVRGSQSMAKGKLRSCGPGKTRMKGVSFGRKGTKETIVRVNYGMLEGLRLKSKFGDVNMMSS